VLAFSASMTAYVGEALWPGVSPAQSWRDALPLGELIRLLRAPARSARPVVLPDDPGQAGTVIAALIKRVVAGENPAGLADVSVRARPAQAKADGIGVVVPFEGDDVAGLRRCLNALLKTKREQDEIVVSVRGAFADAAKLCEELNVLWVRSTSGGDRWNMSAARNAGWRWLQGATRCALVAFVDADVVVPHDYLARLAREAYKRPGLVLTPYVIDEGGDVSTARIASGMSMFPIELLEVARGFDEEYVGWGEEDLDLLHRLREMHGIAAVPLPNMPPAIHTPHEAHGGDEQKARDHEANLARYRAVARRLDAGERVEVNLGEWGFFHVRNEG
jgi:hypothetical protein